MFLSSTCSSRSDRIKYKLFWLAVKAHHHLVLAHFFWAYHALLPFTYLAFLIHSNPCSMCINTFDWITSLHAWSGLLPSILLLEAQLCSQLSSGALSSFRKTALIPRAARTTPPPKTNYLLLFCIVLYMLFSPTNYKHLESRDCFCFCFLFKHLE